MQFWLYAWKWMWKWCDIKPSMVTHTRNSCSAFTHPKCTHPAVNTHTHTPWTHTRSSGQPFMLRCLGGSWGFGALHKGTSSWYWRWREHWTFTPPTDTIASLYLCVYINCELRSSFEGVGGGGLICSQNWEFVTRNWPIGKPLPSNIDEPIAVEYQLH